MRKFKFFIDCNKEEKWLSEMLQKGYELENVSFGYKFHSIKQENTKIRIDYRTFKKKEDFIDYCSMFSDSGWKHLVGSRCSEAQYFKNNSENTEEDIFSDSISKAGKYKRLSTMRMTTAVCFFMLSSSLIFGGNPNVKLFLHNPPKSLYFTPGLWESTGITFWVGFLFETPFAIMRGCLFILPLAMIIYIFLLIKARASYKKQKKSI
ncbi:DUF2812 domain-containing protein [Clostridium sp.]|uniref:DUF2812 domain-containing protein n=1 Tax=Clostridium sp. TaxID=1506 RepID=UPI003D6D8B0A